MNLITPVYAAVLALVFVALSVRTLRLRRRLKIAIGDSGNEQMLRAVRAHSNFAEYVPITLLALLMLETIGGQVWQVHVFGTCLLLGRVVHALGVSRSPEDFRLRTAGMALTFIALVGASMRILLQYLA